MAERRGLEYVFILLAGWAHALSLAAPWDGQARWWLQLLSLAVLATFLDRGARRQTIRTFIRPAGKSAVRQAALTGGLYALASLAGAFWWMYVSMQVYGGLHPVLAVFAVFLLAAALALYYAAAAALYQCFAPRLSPALRALLFAALWLLAELARGRWFTGFGWGGSGYAHVEGLLAGYAPWLGVYGLGFIAAWLAMTLAQIRRCGNIQRGVFVLVLLLPLLPVLAPTTTSSGKVATVLLQGNIPQDQKFQAETGVPLALLWYAQRLLDNQAPLIVAPETALPVLPQRLPRGYWDALVRRYENGEQAALIGLPWGSRAAGYTNAAIGLVPGQTMYRYDKQHLVPFGEFVPWGFQWFTKMMDIPLGDFTAGTLDQPSFEWQGQRFALNICYEDLFGEELGARFADETEAPTVFVNLSNIAWFGDTVAVAQHLNISRMRALEFARPFVRSTNTGATALIDHRGAVQALLPSHTRGALEVEVEGREGLTFYALWVSRVGLWPLWILGLAVLLAAMVQSRRQREAP